jgi:hypothetical protein
MKINEIDRRGFLKGAGIAAVAGATGYKYGQGSIPPGKEKYFNPKLWYLSGYIDTTYLNGWDKDNAFEIISEVNGILRNTNDWDKYVRINQEGHQQYWKDLDKVRGSLGLPPFKQEPLAKNAELFRPWQEKRMALVFAEIKKLVDYKE